MNRGSNDLLEAAYRNLARETTRIDLIVTVACLIAVVLLGVFA